MSLLTSFDTLMRGSLALFHSSRYAGTFCNLTGSNIFRFVGALRHLSTTLVLNDCVSPLCTFTQCFHNALSSLFALVMFFTSRIPIQPRLTSIFITAFIGTLNSIRYSCFSAISGPTQEIAEKQEYLIELSVPTNAVMNTLACLVKSCPTDLKCLSTRMELSHFECVLWVFSLRLNIVSHFPTYSLKWHKMHSMRYTT